MRKTKVSGIQAYLESTGILETGSMIDIQDAKRKYWNMRKRESKQAIGKVRARYTVHIEPGVDKQLQQRAKVAHMSTTRYIQQAAIAAAFLQYQEAQTVGMGAVQVRLVEIATLLRHLEQLGYWSSHSELLLLEKLRHIEDMLVDGYKE